MRTLLLAAALLCACANPVLAQPPARVDVLAVPAPGIADADIRVRVLVPDGYDHGNTRYPVLYVNDGQDLEAVDAVAIAGRLHAAGAIRPFLLVAIDMPPDRMAGYGFEEAASGAPIVATTRYGPVGANAGRYAHWLTGTLLPTIDARYRTQADAGGRSLLGWSLGAASSFSIGWQRPGMFSRIGAFSPSFWLSTAAVGASGEAVQAGRIAHALARRTNPPHPMLYVAVGDAEETGDRDRDGVVDVLDDAGDLLQAAGLPRGDLRVIRDGRHDQAGWRRMLPGFLLWAYGHDRVGLAARP